MAVVGIDFGALNSKVPHPIATSIALTQLTSPFAPPVLDRCRP